MIYHGFPHLERLSAWHKLSNRFSFPRLLAKPALSSQAPNSWIVGKQEVTRSVKSLPHEVPEKRDFE
jgi:hypothetical protein